ncbi:MAG: methyltransferase domain-containing protein [Methanobacterium sp. ERen5]|nr:MAG: methyltransferase domain-containing protein [Methanobacterium sp. ERen5]
MFKWDAKEYQKSSSAQQKWAKELIKKMDINGSEKMLDLGCGDGKITSEIATHLETGCILGIDSSEDMIKLANETFPENEQPNLKFKVKDFQDLNYDEDFDLIFSNAALHWAKDHSNILKSIQRSLKPNGKLLIQMGGKGNAKEILDIGNEMTHQPEWNNYFQDFSFPYGFYDTETYGKWLKEAGLKALRVELISKIMDQNGVEGLKSWMQTVWLPYTQRIPTDLQEKFIDDVANKYLESHPLDKDGMVHVNMVRLEVEALNSK